MRCRLLIPVLLLLALSSCPPAGARDFTRYTEDYFGTVCVLRLYDDPSPEQTWAEVKAALDGIGQAVSLSVPDSDISRFNRLAAGESIPVSDITAAVFLRAREAFDLTGGLYDPTVYPLVDLWGFSPRFNRADYAPVLPYDRPLTDGHPAPPDERWISALLPLVGLDGVTLDRTADGWYLTKHTPAVTIDGAVFQAQLDLGGIAKGFACDRVRELLLARGCTSGCFLCGDSSMTFLGGPGGKPFRLTVRKPRLPEGPVRDTSFAALPVENISLATSSDATHFYLQDGVRRCHLIDPRTGWPVNRPDENGVQSGAFQVTVIGRDAALLDALGTALCLMGPDRASAFFEGREERMLMVCGSSATSRFQVVTGLDPDILEITDPTYAR